MLWLKALFRSGPFKLGLRIALSALALWLVSRRISVEVALELMGRVQPLWVLLAALSLVLSHSVSSERARLLWAAAGAALQARSAWRLYWQGMFYSLFLPGGVGGDGYKTLMLKRYSRASWPSLIKAGLLDRGYGVLAILWLSAALGMLVLPLEGWQNLAVPMALLLFFPALWLGMKLIFPAFLPVWKGATALSLLKQVLQAGAAVCLLMAMQVPYHHAYPMAFLLSSLALLLPISVGGMGARELMLSYLPASIPIVEEKAVAMSLLFFVLNTAFSLLGAAVQALPLKSSDGKTLELNGESKDPDQSL